MSLQNPGRFKKSVACMMPMPDMVPAEVPSHWLVYFGVDDTDATVAKAIGLEQLPWFPTDIPPENVRR